MISEKDKRWAWSYLDGTLDPDKKVAFENRLNGDQSLADYFEEIKQMDGQLAHLTWQHSEAPIEDLVMNKVAHQKRWAASFDTNHGIPWIYMVFNIVLVIGSIVYLATHTGGDSEGTLVTQAANLITAVLVSPLFRVLGLFTIPVLLILTLDQHLKTKYQGKEVSPV